MRQGRGRIRAALLAGSLVLTGGVTGALAQGSRVAEDRGRLGAVDRTDQARPGETAMAQPVAAEVKALVVTGTVMSIDREARSVVLRDDTTYEELTVQIPKGEASFDQMKVGDRLDVNVLQPLELAPPTQ